MLQIAQGFVNTQCGAVERVMDQDSGDQGLNALARKIPQVVS